MNTIKWNNILINVNLMVGFSVLELLVTVIFEPMNMVGQHQLQNIHLEM